MEATQRLISQNLGRFRGCRGLTLDVVDSRMKCGELEWTTR
jgi:hypothetical protein